MRLCLPARMGGGGKAESLPLARASGRTATATRGWLFCFGNERAKPLAFPHNQMNGGDQPPPPQRGTGNGTLARCDACRTPCARACGPAGVRTVERQECQRVSSKCRTLRSEAGKSATLKSPAHVLMLLIVTGTAKTSGLVRAAHRAARPKGQPKTKGLAARTDRPEETLSSCGASRG